MEVPFDYHRSIIGQKGQSIRELSDTHNVHIEIPNSEEHLDIIKVQRSMIKHNQIIYIYITNNNTYFVTDMNIRYYVTNYYVLYLVVGRLLVPLVHLVPAIKHLNWYFCCLETHPGDRFHLYSAVNDDRAKHSW